MAMEIYEDLYLSRILLSFPLEIGNNSLEFRKEMISIGILINIPMSIEVITLHSSPIVAEYNSINVHHGYQHPTQTILRLQQPIDEALHHPRPHTLSGMLPRHSHHDSTAIDVLIHQKCLDFIAQNSP